MTEKVFTIRNEALLELLEKQGQAIKDDAEVVEVVMGFKGIELTISYSGVNGETV